MKTDLKYRLSESSVLEPLVNGWYAWSHLISPVPAALHLVNHQIPTLRSYLDDPAGHARMARDPQFAGSPFCDVPPSKAHRVRELLERTEREQRANIAFARDIVSFSNFLQVQANGQRLNSFYNMIPDSLRGYVELVYDYYHHPTVRFMEGLLYESKYYNKELQSFRIFRLSRDGERPFFISTPRFVEAEEINWKISFDDPTLDEFLKLDLRPQPLAKTIELLGLQGSDEAKILPYLTEAPVVLAEKWREKQVRVRYFGHACALVEWNGVALLTDACVSALPANGGLDRFSFHDLPEEIDFALITHEHQDHFTLESLLRLRPRIQCLVVPKSSGLLYGDVSLKLLAQRLRFKQVVELDPLEAISLPDGEIIGIPFLGEHGDLALSKIAYIIRAGKQHLLFAADSDCLDHKIYEKVREIVGPVETVFLGTESVGAPLTWKHGSLFPQRPSWEQDQTRRQHGCDAERALQLMEALGARRTRVLMGRCQGFYCGARVRALLEGGR